MPALLLLAVVALPNGLGARTHGLLASLDAPCDTCPDFPIPLRPGAFWEYRESASERIGELDSTTDETTRFEVRGTPGHFFIHQTGGADPASGPVEIGEGFIRLTPWTGEDALPVPLEVGRAGPPSAPGAITWKVETEEEVTVPAGTFRALRCALRTSTSVSILWIAPGVGVVKEQQGTPKARPQIERVLVRRGPA
jgi:hypothetical protein